MRANKPCLYEASIVMIDRFRIFKVWLHVSTVLMQCDGMPHVLYSRVKSCIMQVMVVKCFHCVKGTNEFYDRTRLRFVHQEQMALQF